MESAQESVNEEQVNPVKECVAPSNTQEEEIHSQQLQSDYFGFADFSQFKSFPPEKPVEKKINPFQKKEQTSEKAEGKGQKAEDKVQKKTQKKVKLEWDKKKHKLLYVSFPLLLSNSSKMNRRYRIIIKYIEKIYNPEIDKKKIKTRHIYIGKRDEKFLTDGICSDKSAIKVAKLSDKYNLFYANYWKIMFFSRMANLGQAYFTFLQENNLERHI